MIEKSKMKDAKDGTEFSRNVDVKVKRKLKAMRNPSNGAWFGLGMMGLIGWSVVVPTLLGAAFGMWLDNRHAGGHSWTLMLLLIGLIVGCLNAWHWVKKEDKEMHDEQENDDE